MIPEQRNALPRIEHLDRNEFRKKTYTYIKTYFSYKNYSRFDPTETQTWNYVIQRSRYKPLDHGGRQTIVVTIIIPFDRQQKYKTFFIFGHFDNQMRLPIF